MNILKIQLLILLKKLIIIKLLVKKSRKRKLRMNLNEKNSKINDMIDLFFDLNVFLYLKNEALL